MRRLLSSCLLLVVSATAYGSDTGFAPWDFVSTERIESKDEAAATRAGEGTFPILALQSIFQAVSDVDGDRCPMMPTCSTYSLQAMKKHGFVAGWVLTVDRLIRELDEQDMAPVVAVNGEYRAYDPVKANDFWWFSDTVGSPRPKSAKSGERLDK